MIGVGAPTQNQPRPCISLIMFQPNRPRQLYAKQYLHEDELPFFTSGERLSGLVGDKNEVALAICYELSVPQHAAAAASRGAEIYIASVAKFVNGIDKANKRLAEVAKQHHMTVFMANCIGPADGAVCAGQSTVWNNKGLLLRQLDDKNEAILILDTNTENIFEKIILTSE